jgi:hypothetical protein
VGSQECVGKQTRHMGQPSAWPIKIKWVVDSDPWLEWKLRR